MWFHIINVYILYGNFQYKEGHESHRNSCRKEEAVFEPKTSPASAPPPFSFSISSRCVSQKELLCELNHTPGHYKAALTMKVFVQVLDVLVH